MGLAVVTVASGGLPVVESTIGGTPVTEAANGWGVAVTKVVARPGMPVVFETIGVAPPVSFTTTWNSADKSANMVLSNGNLTGTVSAAFNSCSVRANSGQSTGKYYWEVTYGSIDQIGTCTGLAPASASLPIMSNAANGSAAINGLGVVKVNNTDPFGGTIGAVSNGTVIKVAADLGAKLIWFKVGGGNWNNSPANNPATGVGGTSISTMTFPARPFFTGDNATGVQAATVNFGASAFTGAVPAGFTAGWPA